MPEEIATGLGCPACARPKDGEGVTSMLYNRVGKFSYYCRNGHEYNDMQELLALNPQRLPVPQKKTIQQGHETVNIQIPPDLKQDLLQKFGSAERLSQTLAGVLRVLAEKNAFLFNEVDVERTEKILGERPKDGSHLVGILYERQQVINNLRASLDSKQPQGEKSNNNGIHIPEGKVLLDSASFIGKAVSVARFRGQPLEQVLQETLRLAFENGWA